MVRYTLPPLHDPKERRKSYDIYSSEVYPWTNGRFVLRLYVERGNDWCTLGRLGLTNPHVYVVDVNGLTTVMRERSALDHPNDDPGLIKTLDKHSRFVIPVDRRGTNSTYYMEIPDRKRVEIPDPLQLRNPPGGEKWIRRANFGIMSGSVCGGFSEEKLFKFFMPDLSPSRSEVLMFSFSGKTGFSIKQMAFARAWYGEVCSVAISDDNLLGCALIGYDWEPWEVVIWDIDL